MPYAKPFLEPPCDFTPLVAYFMAVYSPRKTHFPEPAGYLTQGHLSVAEEVHVVVAAGTTIIDRPRCVRGRRNQIRQSLLSIDQ